jgi:hypothetical protein
MTIKEYAEKIRNIALKYPDAIAVYSCDDEGNHYDEAYFDPSFGKFNRKDGEFYNQDWIANAEGDVDGVEAVCIN